MPNIPINVYFWLLSGVTESYRATITEISYLELPSGNQSKNVIKPRRVAVTWVFLFCWHPLTSSNSVWVWASPLTALLPQPPETVLSHIAFTAGQWCYSTSDTKEKKNAPISEDRVSRATSRKQSEITLLTSPSHEGLLVSSNTGLSSALMHIATLMHIARPPITYAFWLVQKAETTCAGNPLSYECCVTLGLQRETPSKSQKCYWHWYLEHWFAVTGT